MAPPNQSKFENKLKALLEKGGLSVIELFSNHRPDLSSMLTDARFWVLFLTTELKVWDTKEECWINTIKPAHEIIPSSCCLTCDQGNQLIMFCTKGLSMHYANIYNFAGSEPLATRMISRANDRSIQPVKWRIINDRFILFNDEFHWHEYDLVSLKGKQTSPLHFSYSSSQGFMSNEGETFYHIEEIIHVHQKVAVMFIRCSEMGPKSFIASVRTSKQGSPVGLDQMYMLPVTVENGFSETVSLEGTMLTVGTHKIDMSEFIN